MSFSIAKEITCPKCKNKFYEDIAVIVLGDTESTEMTCPKCKAKFTYKITKEQKQELKKDYSESIRRDPNAKYK